MEKRQNKKEGKVGQLAGLSAGRVKIQEDSEESNWVSSWDEN